MSNKPAAWINKVTFQYLTELGYSAKVYLKRSDGDIPLYTHPHPDNLGLAESIIKQQQVEIEMLKAENKSLIDELQEWEDDYERED